MRSTLTRSITALILVIAMTIGMTASLGGKAQAAPGTYTLRFSNNGVSGVSNLPKDVATTPQYPTVKIPTQKPTRANFVFQGYDTSSAAKTVVYKPGDSIKLTKALTTLYPVWAGGPSTFSITFSNNGISGVSNLPKTITTDPRYAVTIPSSAPTREHYDCIGYDTSTSASTVRYKLGQGNVKLTKNITLYPVWSPKQYTVYCLKENKYGSSMDQYCITKFTAAYGSHILTNSNLPKRVGYSRTWYRTSNESGTLTSSTDQIKKKYTYIYPKDTPLSCKATFYMPNGTVFKKDVTLKTDAHTFKQAMNGTSPCLDGQVFIGWKLKNDPHGDVVYLHEDVCIVESTTAKEYTAVFLEKDQNNKNIQVLMSQALLVKLREETGAKHNTVCDKLGKQYANNKLTLGASAGLGVTGAVLALLPGGLVLGGFLTVCGIICSLYSDSTKEADLLNQKERLLEKYNYFDGAANNKNVLSVTHLTAQRGTNNTLTYVVNSIEVAGIK